MTGEWSTVAMWPCLKYNERKSKKKKGNPLTMWQETPCVQHAKGLQLDTTLNQFQTIPIFKTSIKFLLTRDVLWWRFVNRPIVAAVSTPASCSGDPKFKFRLNPGIEGLPYVRILPISSTFFPVHYLLIILTFDAT